MEYWLLGAAWTEAIAGVVTALTAVTTAWLAYKKYLKEENIEAQADRIEVFKTSKQTTELRATEKGLELYLYDIRPGRGGFQWRLAPDQVREILEKDNVVVDSRSDKDKSGVFSIGTKRRWLYSKKLYSTPKELHKDLTQLLERVVELSEVS